MLLVEKSGSGDGGILALSSSTSFHIVLSLSRFNRSSIADLSNADQSTSFSLSISLRSLSGTLTLTTVDICVCEMFTNCLQIKIAIQILAEMHNFAFEAAIYLAPLAVSSSYLDIATPPDAIYGNCTLTAIAMSQEESVFHPVSNRATSTIKEVGNPGNLNSQY